MRAEVNLAGHVVMLKASTRTVAFDRACTDSISTADVSGSFVIASPGTYQVKATINPYLDRDAQESFTHLTPFIPQTGRPGRVDATQAIEVTE